MSQLHNYGCEELSHGSIEKLYIKHAPDNKLKFNATILDTIHHWRLPLKFD